MHLLLDIILLIVNAPFVCLTNIANSISDLSSIFEGLGYSPVCVASALASCERFAKPDCYLHVLYLMPELKSLLREIKCDNRQISVTEDTKKMEGTSKLESSKLSNNFYNQLLHNITSIIERQETKDASTVEEIKIIVNDLKAEKLEQNVAIKNILENLTDFHNDILALKESMDKNKSIPPKINYANSSNSDINKKATNCAEACGVRTVYPNMADKPLLVSCDETSDGGGWTVIQKRDSEVTRQDFSRPWSDYVTGFGDVNGEFWLGLDNIHALTNSTPMELRIDLEDYDGVKKYAKFDSFKIGDAVTKYFLNVGKYSGDTGDSFTYHNGMNFSTYDQDNDEDSGRNCALLFRGGWWYNACYRSNLNGHQHIGKYSSSINNGISWHQFRGDNYSYKKASMKVRPKIE